jgi:outer membrane protein OmpA-like peptidoglycan-associated protein
MTRVFLYLTIAAFASLCWGQNNDSTQTYAAGAPHAASSVNDNQDSAAAPVDPQLAVPDAKDGADPYGRPIEPVATERATEAPLVPPTEQQQFVQNVKDVYFDFNRSELKPEDQATLQQDAEWLKSHPNVVFTIAGQADPRGEIVYNVYLSDLRALATRDALVKMGVPSQQILFAEGWGKLYPVCQQDDESCYGQDRRAHLMPWSPDAGPETSGTASGLE